jgi:hypothetical protein
MSIHHRKRLRKTTLGLGKAEEFPLPRLPIADHTNSKHIFWDEYFFLEFPSCWYIPFDYNRFTKLEKQQEFPHTGLFIAIHACFGHDFWDNHFSRIPQRIL